MFFNPVLRRFPNFAVYIIFWFLIALINFIVLVTGLKLNIMYAAIDSLIFNSTLAILGLSFWFPVQYIPFEKTTLYKIVFSHFIGSIAASAVWIVISYFLLINIINDFNYQDFLINSLGWRFLSGIIFYFFITSIYYVIVYYTELQERYKRESELQNLITSAELRTLKFQINPHFLFNSLNSLSALTLASPEQARTMTIKISDFLRYSLSNNEKQKNQLSEELNILKLYMEIEKIRFGDKFEYSEEVSPECVDYEVPNMILQPLMENAFKHAVYETMGSIKIKLTAECKGSDLYINFINTYDGEISKNKGTGVGLKNISDRLELLYNRKGLLDISNEQGIFSVKLVIPV